MTTIEWTDETWNPTVGCTRVSPGCDNCYAIRVAARHLDESHYGLTTVPKRVTATKNTAPDWTGEVRCLPDRLETPLRWRKPRRVFVDSMSDLFHPAVPEAFIARVFAVMALTPQHTYQVLTKRPQRMAELLSSGWSNHGVRSFESLAEHHVGDWNSDYEVHWPLKNVWLGVSVENQRYADLRIPHLLATPAAVRFLSCEPLLGPVDLRGMAAPAWTRGMVGRIADWCIVGGESGPGARPMHPQWARDLRDQCTAAGVPFFFKQWGEWVPEGHSAYGFGRSEPEPVERIPEGWGTYVPMQRVGKKAAGRELDGRTWDEMPERVT